MREKAEAFGMGFCITMIVASLVWMSIVTFYRMEDTVSQNSPEVVQIVKNTSNSVKITAMEKEIFLDFNEIGDKIGNLSLYDFLIPAEIRAFFVTVKTSTNSANLWLESTF